MDCVMIQYLVLTVVSLSNSLTLAQSRMVPVPPRFSRTREPKTFYKPVEICFKRAFGMTGLKIPICKTILNYSLNKPPIIRCRVGKIDKNTANKLKEAYGGILQQIKHSPSRAQASDDGDMCCPTTRRYQQAPSFMINSYGEYRDIINLPDYDIYQYFENGTCTNSRNTNHCQGTCVQEKSRVYLMVYNEQSPMSSSFEPFDIPSYCSCKNIGKDASREGITYDTPPTQTPSTQTDKPTVKTTVVTTTKPENPSTRYKSTRTFMPFPAGAIRVRYGQVMHKSRFTRPTRPPQPRFASTHRTDPPTTVTTILEDTPTTTPTPTQENPIPEENHFTTIGQNATLKTNGTIIASNDTILS